MNLSKSRRLAALLALALTVSGISVPATDKTSRAADETTTATTTTISGAAAMAQLTDLINSTWTDDPSKQRDTLVEEFELVDESGQLEVYAAGILMAKDSKLKIAKYDANKDYSTELFALHPKKLDVYFYNMMMAGDRASEVKPAVSIKNVKEVRKTNDKKGIFTVKTVSGKTTSYTEYKVTFDKMKKSTTYSKTGKTYKKGSKKISKKVFDKYVKSYNKTKKLAFSKPDATMEPLEIKHELYLTNSIFVNSSSDTPTVLVYTKDDKTNPYVAFTGGNFPRTRYVFGKDEAKDWNAFRKENANPVKFVGVFDGIINSPSVYEITYTKNTELKEGQYIIDFADGADMYYEVIVDESGAAPQILTVTCINSMGVADERYTFTYDNIDYDGQIYEPGSFEEATAADSYVTSTGATVRTLTVDCAGTKKEIKTIGNYRFEPWTDATKGTFTVKNEPTGKSFSWMDLNMDTDDWNEANSLINPISDDGNSFGAPVSVLTWAAK